MLTWDLKVLVGDVWYLWTEPGLTVKCFPLFPVSFANWLLIQATYLRYRHVSTGVGLSSVFAHDGNVISLNKWPLFVCRRLERLIQGRFVEGGTRDLTSPSTDSRCYFHFSVHLFLSGCDIRLWHSAIIMKDRQSYMAFSLLPRATNRSLATFVTECRSLFFVFENSTVTAPIGK